MKRKDLIDSVVEQTGLKKADARKAVETALTLVREALEQGTDVHVPPLGRIKVKTRGEGAEAVKIYKLILQREKDEVEAPEEA